MIATTGAQLLPPSTVSILLTRLLPLATIVTPNVPEALQLLRDSSTTSPLDAVRTVDDLGTIGHALRTLGPRWVLVKGGHCPFNAAGVVAGTEEERERVVDVLVGEGEGGREMVVRMETGYCRSRHTHGTGCSLACELVSPWPPLLVRMVVVDACACWLGGSGYCVQLVQGDGYTRRGEGGVSLCPGGHQDGTGVGRREWAAESLPLRLYPAVFTVRDETPLSDCPASEYG